MAIQATVKIKNVTYPAAYGRIEGLCELNNQIKYFVRVWADQASFLAGAAPVQEKEYTAPFHDALTIEEVYDAVIASGVLQNAVLVPDEQGSPA